MLYQGNGGEGTLTSTHTGEFLEHPATYSQKHRIRSQVDNASRFPPWGRAHLDFQVHRRQLTLGARSVGSESDLLFEPQPFHLLGGDLGHVLLHVLFWSQFPYVKENVKVELLTLPTTPGVVRNFYMS